MADEYSAYTAWRRKRLSLIYA